MTAAAIIGTTRWGTTLAILLGQRGVPVKMLARTPREARLVNSSRQNPLLPGSPLPESVQVTASPQECLASAALVIFAVPSQSLRANVQAVKECLVPGQLLVSASKGLEEDTTCRMSQAMQEVVDGRLHSGIAVLSGPNLSGEILRGLPAASVVAAQDLAVAHEVRALLANDRFTVEVTTDVVGVEMGGALKNVVAIGAGLADGFGHGENAKATLLVHGLADMVRLAEACGAREQTMLGLAGLGDLLATCSSTLSRNHYVGEQLARGCSLEQALASQRGVCEGVPTTKAAWKLSQDLHLEMPVFRTIYRLLFEELPRREADATLFCPLEEPVSSR